MTLIVDASVALKWVLDEEGSEQARALVSDRLTAPDIWLAEAANALWKRARRGEIQREEVDEALAILTASKVIPIPAATDAANALRLAGEIDHPVYDCLYLAAALRLDAQVVTADARFVRVVAGSRYAAHIRPLLD